ncbi:hypothetical protein E2C01_044718 [Portunus trituberculatus]|uniref:Uncharacterized protein n=1 Tax=Portunus trituberculatus TaxID=210409 RepID=A0A5B7G322_PORTR|nr:hypothetical protein [Portunus trituberculatus]
MRGRCAVKLEAYRWRCHIRRHKEKTTPTPPTHFEASVKTGVQQSRRNGGETTSDRAPALPAELEPVTTHHGKYANK